MAVSQVGPGCPAFDTRNPAGRELIIATNLSARLETSGAETSRVSEFARCPVLADPATDMAPEVAAGPTLDDRYRFWSGGQIGCMCCADKSNNRKQSSPDRKLPHFQIPKQIQERLSSLPRGDAARKLNPNIIHPFWRAV